MTLEEELSLSEYNDCKQHIQLLLKNLYTKSITTVTSVVTIWALAFSIISFSNITIMSGTYAFKLFISNIVVLASTCILYPFFKKEYETLDSLAQLSCYLKVFYEIPSIKREKNIMSWENSVEEFKFSSEDLNQKRIQSFFDKEYVILAFFSIAYVFGCSMLQGYILFTLEKNLYGVISCIMNVIVLCIQLVIFFRMLHYNSFNKMTFSHKDYTKKYNDLYKEYHNKQSN